MVYEIFVQEWDGGPFIKIGEIKTTSIEQVKLIMANAVIKEKE